MTTQNEKSCTCNGNRLIFACSGAADVGELTDRVARELKNQGVGKMYCLAGVGGNVEQYLTTTKEADAILAIDGCQVACAKKVLDNAGITKYDYIQITGLGYEKGKTPVTPENINAVVGIAKKAVDYCKE